MVSPPLVSPPPATTPLVSRQIASPDVSHRHVASCPERANGAFTSLSTPSTSLSTPHFSSTHPLVTRPSASSLVSCSHIASRPEPASVAPDSLTTPPPSHSMSPSSVPTASLSRFYVASHVARPHVTSRPEQAGSSSRPSSITLPSRSSAHSSSSLSSPPRKKRSRRCFVCGGTGKHRLSPRFCPRTYELLSKHLAKFDANFRLVSDDGSPLPMTRHPGGVAAHLLSRRRLHRHTYRVSSRSISESPSGFESNPPHVPQVPRDRPVGVPRRIPNPSPGTDQNPPHAPRPSVIKRHHIPSTESSFESICPHFPPVERDPSPPLYLPIPVHDSYPPSPFRILIPVHDSPPRPETPPKVYPMSR
ncbi:hypothetical protein MVEN_00054700 [Mycena venus]|uniref:Uncharacterized protein n=1 Tax=Mycena venus TaxID=2733690 RepID=A0A8H7DG76_9AGAR|nr:hypothetical protein MVEN_00054700 [Mycena venus]